MAFSTKQRTEEVQQENGFIRSKRDNTLLPELQVKDLKSIVTEDCINVIDADSIPYKSASAVETDYIEVLNLTDDSITTYDNITEFKGNLRTEGAIKPDSKLGIINIKREAKGEEPFKLTDFKVTPKKKLKFEKGAKIDGKSFENSFEVCKHYMDKWIEAIKVQTQVPEILLVMGSGLNHRHDLLLPHQYKSDRTSDRPLLLKEARQYLFDNYPSEMAQQREEGVSRGIEADELVDEYGFKGYLHYRKTGKFSYIKSALDKDSHNPCGIIFDYTKDFNFAQPQAWLVEHRDIHAGSIELVKNKIKGFGLKHAVMQILLEDSADEYGSRKYLPDEMKKGISYGPSAFYKDFVNLESPKEILQKMVNKFYEWFPEGVKYQAWNGTEIDEDSLYWLNLCFLCMYMRLKKDDPTQVTDWLDQYEVDYSKLVGNNKPPIHPLVEEQGIRDNLEALKKEISSVMEVASDKSGKVADKNARFDEIKDLLGDMKEGLDNFYNKEHNTQEQ